MRCISSKAYDEIRLSFCNHLQDKMQNEIALFDMRLRNSVDPEVVPADLRQLLKVRTNDESRFPIIGFNSQVVRAGILLKLIRDLDFDSFIETGTYLGGTCFLVAAQTDLPIKTCDLPHRLRPFATVISNVLKGRIELCPMDSRAFLTKVFQESRLRQPFFYLDAHWELDIPLLGELEVILRNQSEFAIVIDDFRVPQDPGFGFDSYGDVVFEWDYIQGVVQKSARKLVVLYPSYSSDCETGNKRGFILVASEALGNSIGQYVGPDFLKCA